MSKSIRGRQTTGQSKASRSTLRSRPVFTGRLLLYSRNRYFSSLASNFDARQDVKRRRLNGCSFSECRRNFSRIEDDCVVPITSIRAFKGLSVRSCPTRAERAGFDACHWKQWTFYLNFTAYVRSVRTSLGISKAGTLCKTSQAELFGSLARLRVPRRGRSARHRKRSFSVRWRDFELDRRGRIVSTG